MTFVSVRILLFLRFLWGLLDLYKYRLLLAAFSTLRCIHIWDSSILLVFMTDIAVSRFPIFHWGKLLAEESSTYSLVIILGASGMNILKFLTHLGSVASTLAQCLVQVHARPLSQGHPVSRRAIPAAPLLSECGEGVGQGRWGVPGTQYGAGALWEVLRCAGEAQGWRGSGDLQGVAEVDCITPDTGFLAFGLPRVEMRWDDGAGWQGGHQHPPVKRGIWEAEAQPAAPSQASPVKLSR